MKDHSVRATGQERERVREDRPIERRTLSTVLKMHGRAREMVGYSNEDKNILTKTRMLTKGADSVHTTQTMITRRRSQMQADTEISRLS